MLNVIAKVKALHGRTNEPAVKPEAVEFKPDVFGSGVRETNKSGFSCRMLEETDQCRPQRYFMLGTGFDGPRYGSFADIIQ